MTLRKAIELSLFKWEFIKQYHIDHGNNSYPSAYSKCGTLYELRNLAWGCGLCDYMEKTLGQTGCSNCPLYVVDGYPCYDDKSSFQIYMIKPCEEYAQKMIDLINKIKIEE